MGEREGGREGGRGGEGWGEFRCRHDDLKVYNDVCISANRIYQVHDEVKDKEFELEMSWVGEGKSPKLHV